MSAARTDIEVLAPDGGFILAPGCALSHPAAAQDIAALVEAAHAVGRYA